MSDPEEPVPTPLTEPDIRWLENEIGGRQFYLRERYWRSPSGETLRVRVRVPERRPARGGTRTAGLGTVEILERSQWLWRKLLEVGPNSLSAAYQDELHPDLAAADELMLLTRALAVLGEREPDTGEPAAG